MATDRSGSSVSGFWVTIAAVLALIGAILQVIAFFDVGIPGVAADGIAVETDLLWPKVGFVVAFIALLAVALLGFMKKPEIKTAGVVAGYVAVGAILICNIFIGGRMVVTGDEGARLIEVSIIGNSTWMALIASVIVAYVTTFAASRRKS